MINIQKILPSIKNEWTNLDSFNDNELDLRIQKIKKRSETHSLENLIPEWFALVQKISSRELGLKHFDTQLIAGILLHQGKIVEMKTGEGKTLASTLPVSLNALTNKGVHVVTVNEYLAERDQNWMGKIYRGLGLTVGLVKSTNTQLEKKNSYASNITYLTNSELVFDYLRDSSATNKNEIVQRPFHYCVIDEIDSILIDEARTPLIISTIQDNLEKNKLYLAKSVINDLIKETHFQIDEKRKDINLTEIGYQAVREKLGQKTLYDATDPWILEIINALKAKYLFQLNKDYIVFNNKICIVDEFTGRVMEDRRWSLGIHEAIETKETVEIGGGTKTKTSITYQNFFPLYPKLSGMTGTAKTAEKEFKDIYKLEVELIPPSKPMIRKDLSDIVYQTELAKWKAVLTKSKECFISGQPLLIGTASVEKSEFLSELLQISKIPHQVLNAKPENVRRESEIIAQAGERFTITIATNMAGRGTDIILGGNHLFKVKQLLTDYLFTEGKEKKEIESTYIKNILSEYGECEELLHQDIANLPYSIERCKENLKNFYHFLEKERFQIWEQENLLVKSLGGLFVLGTERHETRRIDNQLRGRAGRQGDPGFSQFYVSLEDDLIKLFGGDNIRRWIDYLMQDKDVPLESDLLTTSLENAQKKVESYNYDLRKNVFQYDEILNIQRKQLFQARNEILNEEGYPEFFLRSSESLFDEQKNIWKKDKGVRVSLSAFGSNGRFVGCEKEDLYCELWVSNDLRFAQSNLYQEGFLQNSRATMILDMIDFCWTEHLERMTYLRETISWRSYGQQNPLTEYNVEAGLSFKLMFDQIRFSMIYSFLNNPL